MNQTYYNQISSNLTSRQHEQNNTSLLQLQYTTNFSRNISKCLRNSTDNRKNDSLINMLIQQQQQAIHSARQLNINKSLKTSPIEQSPYQQKQTDIISSSHSQIKNSAEQSQKCTSQFDKLLNENSSLLMRIQELEQKNSLLQMKCQSSRIQHLAAKQFKQKIDIDSIFQANKNNENENRILKELINRQTSLMHIPSVLQTLSLTK